MERTKKPKDRGTYLNPEVFGKPRKAAIQYVPVPKLRRLRLPKVAAQSRRALLP
jgi:hypothetical protein